MKLRPAHDTRPLALVADDEPLVREIVSAVLCRHEWRTIEAADGIAAFAASLDQRLDLLVTDFEMPLISGLELANAIRQNVPDLPILMISGIPGVAEIARESGYRFLSKPFDLRQLIDAIGSLTLNRVRGSVGGQAPADFTIAAARRVTVEGGR